MYSMKLCAKKATHFITVHFQAHALNKMKAVTELLQLIDRVL